VPGYAGCNAIRHGAVDSQGRPAPAVAAPTEGLGAGDLRSAYNLVGAASGGKTVAIVDAYDAPTADADLAVYRAQYGLPACTTANGCFKKVGQSATSRLPRADGGWAQEISLDLDMVSAACPDCKILLVEAKSASFSDLSAAVRYAASFKPVAISNSYGGSDTNNSTIRAAYNQPGVAVTASTGDSGYGVQSPASLLGVVAVGGTSLTQDTSTDRGWKETAWAGAGSGCSTLNPKPTYQDGTATQCPAGKAVADVSAVANPKTGVAVYDSYTYQGYTGWQVFGGTSASSPFIAGVYAQGAWVRTAVGDAGAFTWGHSSGLFDVQGGDTNGSCPATTSAWCTTGTGWDGPTGLGTPNGTGAF
jgi:subtilase family serine protease